MAKPKQSFGRPIILQSKIDLRLNRLWRSPEQSRSDVLWLKQSKPLRFGLFARTFCFAKCFRGMIGIDNRRIGTHACRVWA